MMFETHYTIHKILPSLDIKISFCILYHLAFNQNPNLNKNLHKSTSHQPLPRSYFFFNSKFVTLKIKRKHPLTVYAWCSDSWYGIYMSEWVHVYVVVVTHFHFHYNEKYYIKHCLKNEEEKKNYYFQLLCIICFRFLFKWNPSSLLVR